MKYLTCLWCTYIYLLFYFVRIQQVPKEPPTPTPCLNQTLRWRVPRGASKQLPCWIHNDYTILIQRKLQDLQLLYNFFKIFIHYHLCRQMKSVNFLKADHGTFLQVFYFIYLPDDTVPNNSISQKNWFLSNNPFVTELSVLWF